MKAQMKDNLIVRYQQSPEFDYREHWHSTGAPNELLVIKEMWGYMDYFKTKQFLKSIEGKIVNLVFTAGDAFEEKDNNHWLPNDLWVAI